jgi:hypothetical protein
VRERCHAVAPSGAAGRNLPPRLLETRKATTASLLRSYGPGLRLIEHLEHGGDVVYRHACRLGFEGIVSKRLASRPHAALAQVQEPGGSGGEAGSGRGLGIVSTTALQAKSLFFMVCPRVVEIHTSHGGAQIQSG